MSMTNLRGKRRRVVVSTDAESFFRQSRRQGKFLGPRIALQNACQKEERENFNYALFAFAFLSRRQERTRFEEINHFEMWALSGA